MEEFSDVCSCTCPSVTYFQVICKAKNCDGFFLTSSCGVKVPKCEIQFWLDQRSARKMVIVDIDRNVSRMWARAVARDTTMEVAAKMEKTQAEVRREDVQLDFSNESASEVGGNSRSGFHEDYAQTTIFDKSSPRNLTKLPNIASIGDRYGVSNYTGATIASATLTDCRIIPKHDKSQVIGRQKLGDERI